MSDRWTVKFKVWPYQTGKGRDVDQANIGDENRAVTFKATDIRDALEKAEILAQGVKTNPHVWTVKIYSLAESDVSARTEPTDRGPKCPSCGLRLDEARATGCLVSDCAYYVRR